jgi:hypothetical protein
MLRDLTIGALLAFGAGACINAPHDTTSGSTARDSALQSAAVTASLTASGRGAARVVEVTALDYAFHMPDTLPAGRTAFRFVNSGKVDHEFNLVLLKTGVTLRQFIAAANADQPLAPLVDGAVGVLFARPGVESSSTLSADLIAGRTYAVQCINRDTETSPEHRVLGMFASVTVTGHDAVAEMPVSIDTVLATDYAFRYKQKLPAGLHHFVFINSGKQRHEMSVELLKSGITMKKFYEVDHAGGDVDALIDQSLGVLHTPGGTTPLGTLDIDMLPGREYLIECGFQDMPKSPEHYKLGMFGSIQTASR